MSSSSSAGASIQGACACACHKTPVSCFSVGVGLFVAQQNGADGCTTHGAACLRCCWLRGLCHLDRNPLFLFGLERGCHRSRSSWGSPVVFLHLGERGCWGVVWGHVGIPDDGAWNMCAQRAGSMDRLVSIDDRYSLKSYARSH